MSNTLQEFKDYLNEIQQYFHVNTLLYWDMRNTTPNAGLAANGEAIAYFSTKEFAMRTADKLGEMLEKIS